MKTLTPAELRKLHTLLTAKTGGSDGLRDLGLLESAVCSADMSFGGQEVYLTTEEKAARLMFALVGNHAFVDGNKRIGLLAMLMTLRLAGISLQYTQQELVTLTLSVADGTWGYHEILDWIQGHKE